MAKRTKKAVPLRVHVWCEFIGKCDRDVTTEELGCLSDREWRGMSEAMKHQRVEGFFDTSVVYGFEEVENTKEDDNA